MASKFTRCGKEVLQDGKHFADAVDEIGAMMIANALRSLEDTKRDTPQTMTLEQWGDGGRIEQHTVRREGDEKACSCGLRWGLDETDPHVG